MRSYFPQAPVILSLIILIFLSACQNTDAQKPEQASAARYSTGKLPPQTPQLLEEEFSVYRRQHPDQSEAEARESFEEIQLLSGLYPNDRIAAWADRQALSRAWLKREIEDAYNPDTIDDATLQSAIDAYAFKSGHPALVTVSHILIRPDSTTRADARRNALEAVRADLEAKKSYTVDALSAAAYRLTLAGYRVDMNADLTFPRHEMTSFMNEALQYNTVVEPFADASFKLSEAAPLSPVVESEFGYHIILFQSRTEEKKARLPQDRSFMMTKIIHQKRTTNFSAHIERLMREAPIGIDQEKIEALTHIHLQTAESEQADAGRMQ
ncbi:MAG: peptidylprolyl isomerase [Proteobacteria bacterium]|nr:peptidylprolyl isomerase [Pseudomonadota bacterium]